MKRILIAGTSVYGIENMGDEALLSVLCRELHNNISDLEITWLARHPNQDLAKIYGIQRVFKNLDHDSKEQSIGRWFWGLNPGDPTDHLRDIRQAIEECDLLIIGGDPFQEISMAFYRGLAPQAALMITIAKFLETPVMLYSIHTGKPLKTDLGKELTKFCVTNATAVTLREDFSRKVLAEMGINTDNCHVVADTAWGLDPCNDVSKGREILEKEGLELKSDKVIGFNLRHQYWNWSKFDWEGYREIFANVCDYMVETLGADILFIPNCTYSIDEYYEDDRPVAKEIAEQMKHKDHVHQVVNKYNLYETLSLFPLLDMHLSNRRHSLIFAAVHGVPPVACGGEWHIRPAMEEIGIGDKFVKLENWGVEAFKRSIDATWAERAAIRENILATLPRLREKAIEQGKIAAQYLL